jgi:hypothetical protein
MKFLKQKNISKFSISDNTLIANHYGRAVMDLTGGLRIPKGTTAQRPQLSNVRTPNGPNGYIRYNTTTNAVEAYINGVWEVVRASGASAIQVSRFAANGTETTFGPLNAAYVTNYTASDYNIMILIDNVMQIGDGVNYTVVKRQAGSFVSVSSSSSPLSVSGPGTYTNDEYYVQFATAVPATSGSGATIYVTVFYGYGN